VALSLAKNLGQPPPQKNSLLNQRLTSSPTAGGGSDLVLSMTMVVIGSTTVLYRQISTWELRQTPKKQVFDYIAKEMQNLTPTIIGIALHGSFGVMMST